MVPRVLPTRQALQRHLSRLAHSYQRLFCEESRVREGRGGGGGRGRGGGGGRGKEGKGGGGGTRQIMGKKKREDPLAIECAVKVM